MSKLPRSSCLLIALAFAGCSGKPTATNLASSRFEPGSLATTFSIGSDSVLVELDGQQFDRIPIGTPVKVVDDDQPDNKELGVRKTRVYVEEGKFKGRAATIGRTLLRPAP